MSSRCPNTSSTSLTSHSSLLQLHHTATDTQHSHFVSLLVCFCSCPLVIANFSLVIRTALSESDSLVLSTTL